MNYLQCQSCPDHSLDPLTNHCRKDGRFYLDVKECEHYPKKETRDLGFI
jgi:hypothetical protein